MKFTILRTQKLKHLASIHRSLKHAFRDQDTPNANPELTNHNTHIGANSVDEGMAKIAALLPEKRRSDAVLAIEYLVTASPEALKQKSREAQDAYFSDALQWLNDRHGPKNVVYGGIHRDEETPHLYAYVIPLDEKTGRLNAKKWLGGAKALNQMQTDFAAKVGAAHGLERGIEGSKARHQDIKAWYAGLNTPVPEVTISPEALRPKVMKKGVFSSVVESEEMIAARITQSVKNAYAPAIERAKQADLDRLRAEQMQKTAQALEKQINTLNSVFKPLNDLAVLDRNKFISVIKQTASEVERIKKERQASKSLDKGRSR